MSSVDIHLGIAFSQAWNLHRRHGWLRVEKDNEVNFMWGLIAALIVMGLVILLMCSVYKRETGGDFFKDLARDIFKKG